MTAQPWERLPTETPAAYKAFLEYIGLQDRSVAAAYNAAKRRKGIESEKKRAPGGWERWATVNKWVSRAAAYDADRLNRDRAKAERDHAADIAAYRRRLAQASRATFAAGLVLLDKLNLRLRDFDQNDITPAMLPMYLRAVASVLETAQSEEAAALGIDRLLLLVANENNGQ